MKNVVITGKIIKEGDHYHWRVQLKTPTGVDTIMSNPETKFKSRSAASNDLLKTLLRE